MRAQPKDRNQRDGTASDSRLHDRGGSSLHDAGVQDDRVSGELPAMRVGRSYRVPVAAVQEFMASGLGDWSHGDAAAFGS